MKKSFSLSFSFQVYQVVRYGILLAIAVVFAKTSLTQAEIGQYETFIFISGLVSFFWLNGILKALLPNASEHSEEKFFNAFVLIQVLSIVFGLFVFVSAPLIETVFSTGKIAGIKGLLAIFIVFGIPAGLCEYYYLILKKNNELLIFSIVSWLAHFLIIVTPAVAGLGIGAVLRSVVLSSLLRYAWIWYLLVKNGHLRINRQFILENIKLGTPLILSTLLSGSADYIDGLIITTHFDERTFAVYRYGARELPLALLLANALNMVYLPEFGQNNPLENTLANLNHSVKRLMNILFPVTFALLLISHPLFPIIFNPAFKESSTVFNVYLLLIISRVLMPQTVLNGLKRTKELLHASIVEIILNVSFSLLLVRNFGIAGVAFGTFLAYLAEKIYLALVLKRKYAIKLSSYFPVKLWVAYSALAVLFFIFAEMVY